MATKTLADLVRDSLGVETYTRENPLVSEIDVAATLWLRQNPNRVAALIVNLSVNNLYIGPTQSVSSTRGILITPSGGNLVMHYKEDFDLVGLEWWGTAAADNSAVWIIEWLTQRDPRSA